MVIRAGAFLLGFFLVAATLGSAVHTVVLPRGIPARLASAVFIFMRRVFRLRLGRNPSYQRRDRTMALYSPISLLTLALVWLAVVGLGYALVYWSLEPSSLRAALTLSGSALLTLGFEQPGGFLATALSFTEAAFGLTLLALLITYLPSLYTSFSRREAAVALLEVRAGSPPSGVEMLERFGRIGWLERLPNLWESWERWFAEVEETHTSFPALVFFRSPQPEQSWITAAGAVLDAASLSASSRQENDPDAQLCIRSGYIALRRIADFFGLPHDPDPAPGDPISISREEYDAACARLEAAGVALRSDRDEGWTSFAGWRVNYDVVLSRICKLVDAPHAPWSCDPDAEEVRVRIRGRGSSLGGRRTGPSWTESRNPS